MEGILLLCKSHVHPKVWASHMVVVWKEKKSLKFTISFFSKFPRGSIVLTSRILQYLIFRGAGYFREITFVSNHAQTLMAMFVKVLRGLQSSDAKMLGVNFHANIWIQISGKHCATENQMKTAGIEIKLSCLKVKSLSYFLTS